MINSHEWNELEIVYRKCLYVGVSFALDYDESTGNFEIRIESAAPTERFTSTRSPSLRNVIKYTNEWLDKLAKGLRA